FSISWSPFNRLATLKTLEFHEFFLFFPSKRGADQSLDMDFFPTFRYFQDSMNIAEQIVRIGKLLYQKNFLAACDGNISVREGDTIYITPSGVPKGFLEASQIVTMDLEGKSEHRPSSEKLMHLAIYQNAPKARAV